MKPTLGSEAASTHPRTERPTNDSYRLVLYTRRTHEFWPRDVGGTEAHGFDGRTLAVRRGGPCGDAQVDEGENRAGPVRPQPPAKRFRGDHRNGRRRHGCSR